MKVKIKKLVDEAVIPQYAKEGDAGLDLVTVSHKVDDMGNEVYGTGIAVEIPEGYVGLLFPRSSISKMDLSLTNSVGVIDSGYRGEIFFKFKKTPILKESRYVEDIVICKTYSIGDKVGQLIIMPYPQIEFEQVEHLSETERGTGGYGSTGK